MNSKVIILLCLVANISCSSSKQKLSGQYVTKQLSNASRMKHFFSNQSNLELITGSKDSLQLFADFTFKKTSRSMVKLGTWEVYSGGDSLRLVCSPTPILDGATDDEENTSVEDY